MKKNYANKIFKQLFTFFLAFTAVRQNKKKHKLVHAHKRITQTCVFIMTHYFSIPYLAHQSAIDRPAKRHRQAAIMRAS